VLLGVIAVVAFGIRVAFVAAEGQEATHLGDAFWYHDMALQIADGDGYIRPVDFKFDPPRRIPTAEHPPLFPLVLAVPAVLGLRTLAQFEIWTSLIGVGGVVLIGLLGRRVGGNRVGLVAAGIAACYPMLFQSAALAFSESLYVVLAAAVLLVAYQVYDRPTIGRWILLGVLIGLAALTRGEGGALLVLVAWPLAWWCASDWRGRLVPAATVTVATLVVIAPWMIRNFSEFNRFVPISTNAATAIAGANCDTTYSGKWIGAWHLACIREAYGSFKDTSLADPHYDEADHFAPAQQYGLDYMADHASEVPKVVVARVLRSFDLWDPFGSQIDYDDGDAGVRPWQQIGYVMFWVMIPFGVYGVVLLRRRKRPSWPLIAPIVVVVVASAALHGCTRFRAGAEPGIIVLASVGIVAVATSLMNRSDGARSPHTRSPQLH
jgi:4-amino-4-deoxy-L-arabinose transferase-like glycosyltransferase